jgi:hypothetical protein
MSRLKIFVYEAGRHFEMNDLLEPSSRYARVRFDYTSVSLLEKMDDRFFERVKEPDEADFIAFPLNLMPFVYRCGVHGNVPGITDDPGGNEHVVDFLRSMPFYEECEERHLFFFNDHDWPGPVGVKCVVVNSSTSRENPNPNQVSFPFIIKDMVKERPIPSQKLTYHTFFSGYAGSDPVRVKLLDALVRFTEKEKRLKAYIDGVAACHFHIADPGLKDRRRERYLEVMRQSITALCPRGTGQNSIRFFESMCMGKIPVLISDHCVLPLEGEIDWGSLLFRIAESEVESAGEILLEWFEGQDERTLLDRSVRNRLTWERWFQPEKKAELLAACLRKVKDAS